MFKNIPTFVINLKRSSERRKYIENHLKSKNIQYELIEAVDGKKFTQKQIEAVTNEEGINTIQRYNQGYNPSNDKKKTIALTRGTLGCALSHIQIFKRIVNQSLPYALILEDDALIEDGFDNDFLDSLPQSWDVLLLGYRINNNLPPEPAPCSFWRRYKKDNFVIAKPAIKLLLYGTHGYIVSQQGANRLLKLTHPLKRAIDWYTGNRNLVDLFIFKKPIIKLSYSYASDSTITPQFSFTEKTFTKEEKFSFIKILKRNSFKSILVKAKFVILRKLLIVFRRFLP